MLRDDQCALFVVVAVVVVVMVVGVVVVAVVVVLTASDACVKWGGCIFDNLPENLTCFSARSVLLLREQLRLVLVAQFLIVERNS